MAVLHGRAVRLKAQNRDLWPGQKQGPNGDLMGLQSTHSGLHCMECLECTSMGCMECTGSSGNGKGEKAVLVSGDTQGAETNWEDVYVMLPRPRRPGVVKRHYRFPM